MNGYKIVLLKAIFMLYRLPESERVCSGICIMRDTVYFTLPCEFKITGYINFLYTFLVV